MRQYYEPVTGFEPAYAGMKILCVKPLHHTGIINKFNNMSQEGFEPSTTALKGRCSTD